LEQAQAEPLETIRRDTMELIETVALYKFPAMSRGELEAMLNLSDLIQTRFYQEAKKEGEQEGKLKTVPELLKLGLSLEQIAQALHLPTEEVEAATTATSTENGV
jgi:predicted transposase/invertase (TIGR01784 family)